MNVLRSTLRPVGLAVASTIVFLDATLYVYVWTRVWQNIEIVKRNGEGTGKQRGDLCRYGTMGTLLQRCKYPKLTDWSLLALSLFLAFVLLLFPPIRIFVAFISLAFSFLRDFRYALKARRAFVRLGFAQSVTMQRLLGICRIKNSRRTRRWAKARWRDRRRFRESKGRCVDTGISRFADAAQFRRYIQVITSINFGIPVYSWQIYYAAGKVHNANENALQNPCKNNAARKIVCIIDIRATFPLYCVNNHAVRSNHKYNRWQMASRSILNCEILKNRWIVA